MARTTTAERETEIRRTDYRRECELLIELDAERAVSKALADALKGVIVVADRMTVEFSDARAALAQYAATQPAVLASSEVLPKDAVPSQGGRE